eukprot:1153981-Pelagomonas_calceolata.AAC.5
MRRSVLQCRFVERCAPQFGTPQAPPTPVTKSNRQSQKLVPEPKKCYDLARSLEGCAWMRASCDLAICAVVDRVSE